jgi:hypothetical protein
VNQNLPVKKASCDKFNQVMVNASGSVVTIDGICRQIMVNGSGNQITADAAAEFVFNGADNSLKYARFVNGKQPLVTENQSGNVVEKIAFEPGKSSHSQNKSGK